MCVCISSIPCECWRLHGGETEETLAIRLKEI